MYVCTYIREDIIHTDTDKPSIVNTVRTRVSDELVGSACPD